MINIQSISSGGYLITNQSTGRTTFCAAFDDLISQLQTLYGITPPIPTDTATTPGTTA